MGIPPSTAPRLLRRTNRLARLRLAQEVRRVGLLRSSRAPSCDFASQSSSLRSSGNLTASPQVHPALTRPDICCAGASRDGHSLRLHSPAADSSRVHLFDRFSRDRQCRAGGSHIIPDRTRKAQDTAIKLLSMGSASIARHRRMPAALERPAHYFAHILRAGGHFTRPELLDIALHAQSP